MDFRVRDLPLRSRAFAMKNAQKRTRGQSPVPPLLAEVKSGDTEEYCHGRLFIPGRRQPKCVKAGINCGGLEYSIP